MKPRTLVLSLSLGFISACVSAPLSTTAPVRRIALTHVWLIDGTGMSARPDMTIVITGDRITSIEPSTVDPPGNIRIMDERGKYVIPGLWDMHVHLGDATERALPQFLAAGVTGVRDMGSPSFEHLRLWREEIARGERVGPRILAPGPMLQDGIPDANHVEIRGEAQARQIVDSLADLHVDFIKVHEILTRAEYFAIADEARKRGISFVGHLPVQNDTLVVKAVEATAAGQRSLEHLAGIPYYIRDVSHAAMYDTLRRNAAFVTPTLQPFWVLAHITDTTLRVDPRLKFVSASKQAAWDEMRKQRSPASIAFLARTLPWRMNAVRDLRDAGVPLLAGTDVGVLPYLYPGTSLQDELVRLVESGLTPMEALQAATRNPAMLMGRTHELGTVEVGKLADLVVLDANPLVEITNVRSVHSVVADGRLYDQSALRLLLGDAK